MEDQPDYQQLLNQLRQQHLELDQNLKQVEEFSYVDQLQVQSLKRKKLKLKDQIAQIESLLIPDQPA